MMTKDNAELIATARSMDTGDSVHDFHFEQLADALDAAEAERDAALAVIAGAREWSESQGYAPGLVGLDDILDKATS